MLLTDGLATFDASIPFHPISVYLLDQPVSEGKRVPCRVALAPADGMIDSRVPHIK